MLGAEESWCAGGVVRDSEDTAGSSGMSMSASAVTISVVVSSSISCTMVVGSKISDKNQLSAFSGLER